MIKYSLLNFRELATKWKGMYKGGIKGCATIRAGRMWGYWMNQIGVCVGFIVVGVIEVFILDC